MTPGELIVQVVVTDAVPAGHRVFRRALKIVAVIAQR